MNIGDLPIKAEMQLEDLFTTVYCVVEESYRLLFGDPAARCRPGQAVVVRVHDVGAPTPRRRKIGQTECLPLLELPPTGRIPRDLLRQRKKAY